MFTLICNIINMSKSLVHWFFSPLLLTRALKQLSLESPRLISGFKSVTLFAPPVPNSASLPESTKPREKYASANQSQSPNGAAQQVLMSSLRRARISAGKYSTAARIPRRTLQTEISGWRMTSGLSSKVDCCNKKKKKNPNSCSNPKAIFGVELHNLRC